MFFCFFKQKTAYEMRISDWSSDVCSSDLSASELLSYMVHLGYLRRSRNGRRFRLSMRVAMLGSWVQPDLVRNGRLLRLMDTLADDTGATVVLATNVGVRLQCLHVVRRDCEAPRQGDLLPLLHSAEGHALLLTAERELVRKYVHRLNSEVADESERVRFDDVAADLDAGSARGYVRQVDDRSSSFAILVPNADRSEQLSLCVRAGAGANEDAIVRAMRGVASRTLGLIGVPSALPPHVTTPRQLARVGR